jgi:hypothetical protein
MQMYQFGEIKERTLRDPNEYITDGSISRIACYDKNNVLKGHAIIDTEDVEKCRQFKWGIDAHGYVGNSTHNVRLHQFVSGFISPDHKNRNPLDNRKDNLREATHAQNMHNVGLKCKNKSGYKGVCLINNKWRAQLKHNGKNMQLGDFNTPELAAKAYNSKSKELYGEFAFQNKIPLLRRTPGAPPY